MNFKEVVWLVVLGLGLRFVGPQHVPRRMGHLARGGHMRQEDDTTRLLDLAGDPCRPLTQGDPQAIAQRFHHARVCEARPARALRGMLLDLHLHPVRRALQRPQLGGGGLGIRMTDILLLARLAHRRLQRRLGLLEFTREMLLPSLILATGVHHHGSRGLAV